MKQRKMCAFLAIITLVCSSCGSSSSSGGGGDGDLTYSETVTAYTTEGLNTYTKGKDLGDSYSAFVAHDPSTSSTDYETSDTKMTAFTTALNDYSAHVQTIGSYAATAFPLQAESNIAAPFKDSSVGIDTGKSLYELNATLQAKKVQCDELKAKIPTNMSDIAAFAAAKEAYDKCFRELASLAAEEGFKIVVVESGGSAAGGAIAGGAFIYIVGGGAAALLTGPGILVVTVGALVGQKIATSIYEYCTSSSDKSISAKGVSDNAYCASASVKGTTGTSMPMNTTGGTGTLHVFIEGYAPVMINSVTVEAGKTTTVVIDPVALTEVTDESSTTVETANSGASTSSGTSTASSCSDVVSIGVQNSPADPGPGETVSVTANVVPTKSGCTVTYSVAGTDRYAASGSPTTDSSGQISFTIPGGDEGVHDVVTVTATDSGVDFTLAYTF